MDLDFACKYPFTEEGKRAIIKNNIEISDAIAERAVARVVAAMERRETIPNPMHISDQLMEIGSYGAARMMLAYLKNRYITNKFAVGEAKKAFSLMGGESRENLDKLRGEFGLVLGEFEGKSVLPLAAYLKFAPRSVDYRLVNRNVKGGFVEVSAREGLRLVQEAIKIRVGEVGVLRNAPEVIRRHAGRLMKSMPKVAPSKMSFREGENPPCIEKLLEAAKLHQNLGHQGRWSLAVYLIKKGVPYEKILQVFSNFPDYDERIAGYQIRHAINRDYGMPSCSMMLSYGLCVAECGTKSPLGWKKWKKGKRA